MSSLFYFFARGRAEVVDTTDLIKSSVIRAWLEAFCPRASLFLPTSDSVVYRLHSVALVALSLQLRLLQQRQRLPRTDLFLYKYIARRIHFSIDLIYGLQIHQRITMKCME